MHEAATDGWKYGDPENYDLKHAIAARHGVTPAHVVVGEGIDALFGVVARLHVEPGVAVVTSLGAYPTFAFHIAGNGGRLVTASYRDDREDLDALLALARTERPRLVFLANPDNPMGSWWGAAAVEAFADALPHDVLLCLDEAYADFAPADALPAIDPDDPRVLRFRTFSKAHGMAGLRVGYAFGAPEVVAAFDRVRNHFGVNRVAQAGALASLADDAHISSVVAACRARSRPDRGDRDGQRTACPAVGHQLRDGRLRPTTGRSHGRCWRPSPSATCSSACRAWRRSIAASASARHLTTSSTCWPPSSRARSQRRIVCARRTTDRRLPAVPCRGAWSRAGRRDGRDRR